MRNNKVKGLIERKLEDPAHRKRHDERFEAFKLEVQLLSAIERLNLTYADLAKTLHTSKSNISRDLSAGGISSARLSRVRKMADALGLMFIPLVLPKRKARALLPKIEKLVAA
jgi:hypothetical protein